VHAMCTMVQNVSFGRGAGHHWSALSRLEASVQAENGHRAGAMSNYGNLRNSVSPAGVLASSPR
jgi:hypothetical protein